MAYKPLMDWFDEHEGRKAGDSFKGVNKARKEQGYKPNKEAKTKAMRGKAGELHKRALHG